MKRFTLVAVGVLAMVIVSSIAIAQTRTRTAVKRKTPTMQLILKPVILQPAYKVNTYLRYNNHPIGGTKVYVYEIDADGNRIDFEPKASGTVVNSNALVPFTLIGNRNYAFVSKAQETVPSAAPWIGVIHKEMNLNTNKEIYLVFEKPLPAEVNEYLGGYTLSD